MPLTESQAQASLEAMDYGAQLEKNPVTVQYFVIP